MSVNEILHATYSALYAFGSVSRMQGCQLRFLYYCSPQEVHFQFISAFSLMAKSVEGNGCEIDARFYCSMIHLVY